MLGEASTTEIARRKDAQGFQENRKVAKEGGAVAGNARKELEMKSGKSVVSKSNYLGETEKNISLNKPTTKKIPKDRKGEE